MFMFPGNPRNWWRNLGTERGKVLLKTTVYCVKGRNHPNTVPSVLSTAEPKLLTMLGIVRSMRKTELSRRLSSLLKESLPIKKIDHLSFNTMEVDCKKVRTKLKNK
jgi:hypothetical protein